MRACSDVHKNVDNGLPNNLIFYSYTLGRKFSTKDINNLYREKVQCMRERLQVRGLDILPVIPNGAPQNPTTTLRHFKNSCPGTREQTTR